MPLFSIFLFIYLFFFSKKNLSHPLFFFLNDFLFFFLFKFRLTGNKIKVLNLSSYNYLGFAQSEGPCADAVYESINKYGVTNSSTRMDVGTQKIHQELETLVARYVGKPAAIVTAMGFATNSTTLPALIGKGSLIISDELNHSSLVVGSKNSGAHIRVFKHNGFTFHSIFLFHFSFCFLSFFSQY